MHHRFMKSSEPWSSASQVGAIKGDKCRAIMRSSKKAQRNHRKGGSDRSTTT